MTTIPEHAQALEAAPPNEVILDVDSLKMHFPITRGLLKRR